MSTVLKIILIFLVAIILALALSPTGGYIHSSMLRDKCTGGLFLLEGGCSMEGFVYFYIIALSFLSFFTLKRKTAWLVFMVGTSIFWIIVVLMALTEDLKYRLTTDIGTLAIMLVSFVIGYLLALGVKKLKNNR